MTDVPLPSHTAGPGDGRSRAKIIAFGLILGAGLVLRLVLATRGHSVRYPDEIFQSLEPAHRIVFGYGVVTWEFVRHLRWMGLPLLLTLPQYLARWLGEGPEVYVGLTRAAMAVLSALPVPFLYLALLRRTSPPIAAFCCLLPLFWWENLDFATSTLSDGVSAPLLGTLALLPLAFARRDLGWAVAFAGLAAVTCALRIQLLPGVAVIVGVALAEAPPRGRHLMVRAAAVWAVALALFDVAAGQYPFQHLAVNIEVNLLEGMAARFGVQPWYYFLLSLLVKWGAAMLVPILLLPLGWRSHWRVSLPALALLVAFSLVAHKEYRFIFPATMLLTLASALATAELANRLRRGAVLAALAVPLAATALSAPALFGALTQQEDNMAVASIVAGRLPGLCGVASAVGVNVYQTAGYTYLHRDVPLDYVDAAGLVAAEPAHNVLLMPLDQAAPPAYARVICSRHTGGPPICVWQRPGGCTGG